MGILLKKVRIHGFRGLDNIEVDFEPTTVLVGANNIGKTTLLKALQLALSNSFSITDDDLFVDKNSNINRNKVIIDILFISVDENGNQLVSFDTEWSSVFTDERITVYNENEVVAVRTVIKEHEIRKIYKKKHLFIDEWSDFKDSNDEYWYEKEYDKDIPFYFDEIPFFYLDADRDILDDLKLKNSYLGKILSSIKYNDNDRNSIETLINEINNITIDRSPILNNLCKTLEELDTTMDNPNKTVNVSPLPNNLVDLSKGVKINYSNLSMEYHGMGTRSWSSLLILKAFIYQNKILAQEKKVPYYPIIAIEEPEAHLHPHAQKKLYSQIDTIEGQKIVSTHSSYIAGSAKLKEIRSLNKQDKSSIVSKIDESKLDPEEIRRIYRYIINTRGELYFSKVIILCEGETEEQALPLLLKNEFNKSIIELGVDIIGVGGAGNYYPFMYFANALNIQWYIFSDGEKKVLKSISKDLNKLFNKEDYTPTNMPNNVICLDNEENFEKLLINHGYIDEIKNCLKIILNIEDLDEAITKLNSTPERKKPTDRICETCNQNIFENPIRDYSGEEGQKKALLKLLEDNKTKYAATLAEMIAKSRKPLPIKLQTLFKQIGKILNINND